MHYTRAVNEDPDKIEYRMALERALIEAGAYHVQQGQKKLAAEDLEGAIGELELAVDLHPANRYAQSILKETQARLKEREASREEAEGFEERRRRAQELFGGRPILEPSSTAPIQLRFAEDTSLQKIFEVLSKLSGINILFDESFRDKRVTIDLVDVSFEEALDKLALINRLFYKVVDTSTIIIVPDNAQKHRQYDDLVLRTFYIVNAEVNTVANMLRTIAGIQRVQPNPELKAITVRATPDQVAVAERILELNDKTKSEIMLDIEILQVNRVKALDFGLRVAEYQVTLGFAAGGPDGGNQRHSSQSSCFGRHVGLHHQPSQHSDLPALQEQERSAIARGAEAPGERGPAGGAANWTGSSHPGDLVRIPVWHSRWGSEHSGDLVPIPQRRSQRNDHAKGIRRR